MDIYTKELLLQALQDIRNQGWILSRRSRSHAGAIGNTLEDLLGIQENNLAIPNAAEWELKTQRKNSNSLITLFHMEPSPRKLKFVSNILLKKYGWKHDKAGEKYPETHLSFRQTLNAINVSERGFSIQLDEQERKIVVRFDPAQVAAHHAEWLDKIILNENAVLKHSPYWGFDDLCHKAGTKLHNCILVRAESKIEDGKEYFLFRDILILKKFCPEKFICSIKSGNVYIDFDARTGHNHGTKFRIRDKQLHELYEESQNF